MSSEEIRISIEQGDLDPQNILGEMCQEFLQDYDQGAEWYRRAMSGTVQSRLFLSVWPRFPSSQVMSLHRSVLVRCTGHVITQVELFPQDNKQAEEWFRKAALPLQKCNSPSKIDRTQPKPRQTRLQNNINSLN